jgi:L-2,4-diaminobutyrate decarboxylase
MTDNTRLYSGASLAQITADLRPLVEFQANGLPPAQLEQMLHEKLLPHLIRYDRPTFQSMFNTIPGPEAKLGATLALEYNQGVTNWQVSPGGALLEELTGQALCRLFGLNAQADATFLYSGTYANHQALYLALHRYAEQQGFDLAVKGIAGFRDPSRLVVLASEDAHFSIRHAVRMLGLGEDNLIWLPVNEVRRVDAYRARHIITDLTPTHDVVAVVATAGTTPTGAVDPITPLADLCRQHQAWLHVDGAYGYAYKLVPEWSRLFSGDERADSISWDPHKQLGVPIPSSVLFVKNRDDFKRMALFSSYFNQADDPFPNPGLKSPPSTRPFSALPLVTLLRGQGLVKLVRNLHAPLAAIKELAEVLSKRPGVRLCHPPDTGILCFQIVPPGFPPDQLNQLQQRLYHAVLAEGERAVSITRLGEETVLRVVAVSPQVTVHHLRQTVTALQKMAQHLREEGQL